MVSERNTEMGRLYFEAGLTYQQIGDQFGVSRQRVEQVLRNVAGERHRGAAKKRAQLEDTVAAYERIESGQSTLEQEAERVGITRHGMYGRIYSAGFRFPQTLAPHGTDARYTGRARCRCAECREAHRLAAHQRKLKEPPTHSVSGYINYACRCKRCTEAHRLYERNRRAQRRREKS